MSISSINSYVQNTYSTTQSTQASTNTNKVRGGHHHHHHKSDSESPGATTNTNTNSSNVQTNGTDTLEISNEAKSTLSNQ